MSNVCTRPKVQLCFKCKQPGHLARACPQGQAVGQVVPPLMLPATQARVFAVGQQGTGVAGTLSVFNYHARVLFDTGASHSFISSLVVES